MFFKNKNILVAGGSGFIGFNLVQRLIEEGAKITATFHYNIDRIKNNGIEWVQGDLTNNYFCKKVCKDKDFVFMCAANTSGAAVIEHSPLAHVTPNIIMNSMMLDAAYEAGVKKFVFLSSNSVYPISTEPLKEEDFNGEFFDKYFCVASMKSFSETLCNIYSTKIKNPMATIVIRPGNLFGINDDFEWETSHSTPSLIRRVVERHNPLKIWGDGSDRKDLLYISDFIDGLLKAAEIIENFDIINIASGKSYSITDVLKTILEIEDYKDVDIQYDVTKPTMIPIRLINIDKARNILGFNPKVSLREGLEKTIKWYKEIKKGEK